MDAAAINASNRAHALPSTVSRATFLTVLSANLATLLIACLHLVRQLLGAVHVPLEPTPLILTSLGMAGWAVALRWTWHRMDGRWRCFESRLVQWLPVAWIATLGTALSLAGVNVWLILGFWIVLLVEEAVSVDLVERLRRKNPRALDSKTGGRASQPRVVAGSAAADPLSESHPMDLEAVIAADEFLPANVTQRLTRVRTEDGSEVVYAVLMGEVEAGQRTFSLHVAFCPPLASVPEIEFEQTSGPSASIKTGQVMTCGVRLDIRLGSEQTDERFIVQLVAQAAPCMT